jgi:U3 small nucleolar RNA-associated protein 19
MSGTSKEVARVRALEKQISADPKQANSILLLKEQLVSGKNEVRLASLHALRRLFITFLEGGRLAIVEDDKISKLSDYKKWLQQQLESYEECLCSSIKDGDSVIMAPAIRTMIELVRREWLVRRDSISSDDVRKAKFGIRAYSMLLHSLLDSSVDLDMDALLMMRGEVFDKPDCAYYAWILIKRALKDAKHDAAAASSSKKSKHANLVRNALDILRVLELSDEDEQEEPLVDPKQHLRVSSRDADDNADSDNSDNEEADEEEEDSESEEESEDDAEEDLRKIVGKRRKSNIADQKKKQKSGAGQVRVTTNALQPKAQKKAFSEAWLALLALPLTNLQHKLILRHLPDHVMPNLMNPLLLADFLFTGYAKGGVLAVLALQSLFTLIVQFNLDYPNFFVSLFDLCTVDVFTAKYRVQFLPLLHSALKSTNIPSYIIAAFVKRLMQLALLVPAPCASFCIMQATTLLRSHKECHTLLHQDSDGSESNSKSSGKRKRSSEATPEVYSMQMPSKLEGGADLESSLWEAKGLHHHYLHSAATFSKALESARSTSSGVDAPYINVPDYLDHNYEQLIELELSRIKKVGGCPIAFVKPEKLIPENDVLANVFNWV